MTTHHQSEQSRELQRLKWSCRRGLLELDVLLERFLNGQYSVLSGEQKATFSRLLACSDQELIDWLLNHEPIGDQALQHLVDAIGGKI